MIQNSMIIPWPIAILLTLTALCAVEEVMHPVDLDGDWVGKGRKK